MPIEVATTQLDLRAASPQSAPRSSRPRGGTARLAQQFDTYVWCEKTRPLRPLLGAPAEGAPDV